MRVSFHRHSNSFPNDMLSVYVILINLYNYSNKCNWQKWVWKEPKWLLVGAEVCSCVRESTFALNVDYAPVLVSASRVEWKRAGN